MTLVTTDYHCPLISLSKQIQAIQATSTTTHCLPSKKSPTQLVQILFNDFLTVRVPSVMPSASLSESRPFAGVMKEVKEGHETINHPCYSVWKLSARNPNRIPNVLLSAKLKEKSDPRCKPVVYWITVLKKHKTCNQRIGHHVWVVKKERITIGFRI